MDNDSDIKEELTPEVEAIPDEDNALSGASDPAAKIKKLKEALARSEKERLEYLDGWQRAKADLVNYKKDEGKRLADMAQFLGSEFVSDFLPSLDSFDFALHSMSMRATAAGTAGDTAPTAMEQGILMIRSQMLDILKKRGVKPMETVAGEAFDPHKHESIGEIESSEPPGSIAEVAQQGYTLAGRIIRPARVKLAKGTDNLDTS